ncbi:MAG: hypothetical protein GKR87_00500 [Kiritimatiellae bacterium]|nr:hypothetical protein [Kiritimatiellia bacterium]
MYATTSTANPLVTVTSKVVGTQLEVSPVQMAVPKGIAGSVNVNIVAGLGGENETSLALADGVHIEATLRGPSFAARQTFGRPNEPLLFPPLPLVGDYQLDAIKLVDSATGKIRLEGSPSSIPIFVFKEVLVTRVTSRPLTLDEIQEKGILIDESNFRAVEFEVGFVIDGKTVPVKLPVIAPTFKEATEIIPQAEIDEKMAAANVMNQQLSQTAELPPELEAAGLNIEIQGINFQFVDTTLELGLALQPPPIPALMVIPGNIGFINQFFSVQIFMENGVPGGSGLNVHNMQAELLLPVGSDLVAGTYEVSGDDPLRFARTGTNGRVTIQVQRSAA